MRTNAGGSIDRNLTLNFRFDGKTYRGFSGDTLASALIANGVKLVGRSFKYHRPRGILTAGPEEPNALVELRHGARREPNTKATTIELYDGLEAASQNRWPSLSFDAQAVNGWAAPFLHAGFYYKTFMWPAPFWERLYEPLIRRAAGLGRASGVPDPDTYEKAHAFCDVLIVGAGPAGLMAARMAARSGARVILCEQDFALGGRVLAERFEIDGMPGSEWVRGIEAELRSCPGVVIMPRTSVFGVYDGEYAALERVADHYPVPPPFLPRQRLWKIIARECVVASGAVERIIAFGGNDRPGIMTASAIRTYVNRFGATPGKDAAIFTTTDDGWRTISDLRAAGIRVAAVIDPRAAVPADLMMQAQEASAAVFLASHVDRAMGARGLKRIKIALPSGASATIACDLLGVSGGWNPNLGLTSHLGSKPEWSDSISAFVPRDLPRRMRIAGAIGGRMTLRDALAEGAFAGIAAASAAGFPALAVELPQTNDEAFASHPFWCSEPTRKFAFVDLQNDVTTDDVALAAQEGFQNTEHLKRYTTLGMATDQGKTGAVVAQALMASLTGNTMARIGVPRARPPETPVAIGAFAGHHRGKEFRPYRLTAGHRWAEEQGATFTEAGQWLRAQWFARDDEKDWLQTVSREAATVRSAVGVCDVSTLGKIDIQGTDAGIFLDRVYINTFSTLPVGKARYGVMLREDGFVMDDGTTSRLADDHYFMTTT
ncbi:MAG TPA: 2Fe-2S iron-sulfur cluster-binding protein, partial [Micropepsaceae bacterium]|nr:2Fe-2S iron-sulfur cluster-binding protein [Micropepsaceae bacterium]